MANLCLACGELARDLAINPNTVARAYRELQEDGVLEAVRGMGLSIAGTARRHCQAERTKLYSGTSASCVLRRRSKVAWK